MVRAVEEGSMEGGKKLMDSRPEVVKDVEPMIQAVTQGCVAGIRTAAEADGRDEDIVKDLTNTTMHAVVRSVCSMPSTRIGTKPALRRAVAAVTVGAVQGAAIMDEEDAAAATRDLQAEHDEGAARRSRGLLLEPGGPRLHHRVRMGHRIPVG